MGFINPFRQLTAQELAVTELENAKRERQEAESLSEYYAALVIYNVKRIERLTERIQTNET